MAVDDLLKHSSLINGNTRCRNTLEINSVYKSFYSQTYPYNRLILMQAGNHSTESLYKLGCLITDTVAKQTENITELFFLSHCFLRVEFLLRHQSWLFFLQNSGFLTLTSKIWHQKVPSKQARKKKLTRVFLPKLPYIMTAACVV